jgi:hypothetical protein
MKRRGRTEHLHGLWVLDSHWHTERGELPVYQDRSGDWHAEGFEEEDPGGILAQACYDRLADKPEVYILIDIDAARFIADPGECERVGLPVDRLALEQEEQEPPRRVKRYGIHISTDHQYTYSDTTILCTIEDGTLLIAGEYSAFKWLDSNSPPDEPDTILATSSDGKHKLHMTATSPAGKRLLRLRLVDGAPDKSKETSE